MWEKHQDDHKITVDERRAMIVDEVNRRTSLQVSDICERFGVSEVTVRNDLDKLEKSGKLRRTHGGAVSITRTITVSFPDQRLNLNVEAKRAVTKRAAEFVHDGDTLFVDTGTTAFEFAHFLYDKRDITIVTADLSIASFADSSMPHAHVLVLGGTLRKNHRYITGPITTEIMAKLRVDKAFLAADSFTPSFGFSTQFTGVAEVKEMMLRQSREHYMMMDVSKVRDPCFIRFAKLSDFNAVIMDFDPNGEVERAIQADSPETSLILTNGKDSHDMPLEVRNEEGHIGRESAACIPDTEDI